MRSLGIAAVLVVSAAACSGDDDGGGDATTASSTVRTVAATSEPAVTTVPASVVVTEPPVATINDTEELGGSRLYDVDLDSGAATALGRIGGEEVGVLGLAFAPGAGPWTVYGLTDVPELITFDAADSETLLATVPVTGVAEGSTLLAIDVDPAGGTVLALSDAGVVYRVDPATGAAAAIGDGLGAPIPDPGFGFDVDLGVIRIDVATGEQLRVDPATGAVVAGPAGPIAFDPDDVNAATMPRVVAIAHSDVTLYGVDAATGSLVAEDPSGDGVLTTIGALGIDLTDGASLDIADTGAALLAVPG